MDLIEVQVLAEQSAALCDLPSERGERVILHLVDASIDLPVTDVGIAPLRPHGDRVRWEPALAQPGREETLRKAVGAGGIEVADAGVIGGAQDLVGATLERGHTAIAAEVRLPIERDVSGTTQGGEAEPDRRHHEPGGAKRAQLHSGGYGCSRIRAFSFSNSACESTPDCLNSPICRNCS